MRTFLLLIAFAQPPVHHHPAAPAWSWTWDANVFAGENVQRRKFTDFSAFESQNWFMLAGTHTLGPGELTLHGMTSLEALTLEALGSPQVFQTGEAYHGAPLIDRQHPHDLFMELAATYRVPVERVTFIAEGGLVGAPALGPTPFMHRESARDNPQAPLSHHQMDSTHVTPGVVTTGVEAGHFAIEGSLFRGQEPDDQRFDIERPWLDSWSAQGQWKQGPWRAQVSGGVLHKPEFFEPYDVPRITASVEFTGALGSRPFAATAAWGENRDIYGILDGYLFEWDAGVTTHTRFYGRAENVAKDLLDLGAADPPGFFSVHRISHIAALTAGYVWDVTDTRWGKLGIGADVTAYRLSDDLVEFYGSPHSFHFFLRYRPQPRISGVHVH